MPLLPLWLLLPLLLASSLSLLMLLNLKQVFKKEYCLDEEAKALGFPRGCDHKSSLNPAKGLLSSMTV